MMTMPVKLLDLTDPAIAKEVWLLQRAAYKVEAELVGFDGIPPLHESLEDMVEAPLKWLGVEEAGGRIVAALAYTEADGLIDIDRLVVKPDHFRRGCGAALVGVLDPAATITVSTGTANAPAHRLYEARGFSRAHDEEVRPGVWITHFVKEAAR